MSKVKHLQRRLDDLRERERLAKLHNRELLQQFDEAQDTLRDVLDHTAAMKMLRKEYENCHSHWNHQLYHKTQNAEENKNLKTNHQRLHLHDRGKTGEYQELSIPPEPLAEAQIQTTVFLKKISQYPPSSFPDDLFRPHLLPSRPHLERTTENNDPSNFYLSHTSSPYELRTDQLIPCTAQTATTPKRPPSCLSEDSSYSEDLDVKPVRLSSDQTGVKTSSRVSSEWRTEQTKSNQTSSSDEDLFVPHKSVPSREVSTGSKAMTFSNQKSKHRNGLGCKDTKNKDNTSESHSEGDESDVDESSVKLSQEAQGSGRLKKRPTLKEKQSLSDQSSLEDKDEDSEKDQIDGDGKETSQEDDGEMSNLDISGCSPIEEAYHKTPTSSSSDSAEESASSECDGGVDNMKVCESNQDMALGPVDSDSEDCIVSPQTRSKIIYVIPEHEVKHQHEESNSKSTSDEDSDSSSEEDIERVLAPQEQTQKQRASNPDKSKEPCESDDFYDE